MIKLILIIIILLAGCTEPEKESVSDYSSFSIYSDNEVEHTVFFVSDMVCRDRIKLKYSDVVVNAKNEALTNYLKSKSALDFISEHCYERFAENIELEDEEK